MTEQITVPMGTDSSPTARFDAGLVHRGEGLFLDEDFEKFAVIDVKDETAYLRVVDERA